MTMSLRSHLAIGLATLLLVGACGRPIDPTIAPRTVQQATTVTWANLLPGVYYHLWAGNNTEFLYDLATQANLGGVNLGTRIREVTIPGAPQLAVPIDFTWFVAGNLLSMQIGGTDQPIVVQLHGYNQQADVALVSMNQGFGNAFWYGCRSTGMPAKYKVRCAARGLPIQ